MEHVQIVPAALRDKANALAEAMGHGPDCFSIPLPPDPGEDIDGVRTLPVTHYAFHSWTVVEGLDADTWDDIPAARKGAGVSRADFIAFRAARVENKGKAIRPSLAGSIVSGSKLA